MYGDSALLILNGTSLNSVNALLVLKDSFWTCINEMDIINYLSKIKYFDITSKHGSSLFVQSNVIKNLSMQLQFIQKNDW